MGGPRAAMVVVALALAGGAWAGVAKALTCAEYRASVNRLSSVRGISFAGVRPLDPRRVPLRLLRAAARVERVRGKIFYRAALIDLNRDGHRELVFRPVTPLYCGTGGCTTFVFRIERARLSEIGRITVTGTPLVVSNHRSRGWQDLVVAIGGGGLPADWGVVGWSGRRYALNPTTRPLPSRARVRGVAILRNPRACSYEQEASFHS